MAAIKLALEDFRRVLGESRQGQCWLDDKGRIGYVNPALAQALHESDDALVGRPVADLFAPDEGEKLQAELHALADHLRAGFEARLAGAAADAGPVAVTLAATRDGRGRRNGALLTLAAPGHRGSGDGADGEPSDQRFERAVFGSRAGIWDWDLRSDRLYLAPGFKQLLGHDEAGLQGFHFAEWLHPDDREAALSAVDRTLSTGAPFDIEYRLPHKDGSYRWFHGRGQLIRDRAGRPSNFTGAITDVTERVVAQEALEASEQLFRTVFTTAGVGMTLADPGGTIVSHNREIARILGYERDLPPGARWQELTHREDLPNNLRLHEELVSGQREHYRLVKRYLRRDGEFVWVDTSTAALRDDGGHLLYTINVLSDVTERRRAEEQIRYYQEHLEDLVAIRTHELEAINREVASFSYSVSHDLRGPLRAIDGYSQILLDDYAGALEPQAQGYLVKMRDASQRMARLIDDLLMLSRLSRQQINEEALDLGRIARDVFDQLRESEPERAVEFTLDPRLSATGDPGLMRVVLTNLLGNAWKYTAREAQPRIHFGIQRDGGEAAFFVRDNGVGFEMDYADKLFKAFQRLHSDRDFEGSGVGLATVAQIISRHGGRVWARGEVGRGACFYFSLPPAPRRLRRPRRADRRDRRA